MIRFIPPHLMALLVLLIIVLWVMLLRFFRRSPAVQHFVSDLFGDSTPENALLTFELAKERLANHLDNPMLDRQMRERIEQALRPSLLEANSSPDDPEPKT